MGKKNGTEITKAQESGALAVAGADDFFAAPAIAGVEQADRLVPVLHLFQATSKETTELGKFDLGDLIDVVERRKVGSRRLTVVCGRRMWVKWVKGLPAPEYVCDNKADVPADDLRWTGEGDNRIPPAATETWEFIVLVEGEPFPFLWRAKKTAAKCGKTLYELTERARMQRRIALYELGWKQGPSDKGVYAVPTVRQVGDCPPEMAEAVVKFRRSFASRPIEADDGALGQGHDDSEIPI